MAIPIDISRKTAVKNYNQSAKRLETQRRYRERYPRKMRDLHYRARYGLTLAEYEERFAACGGRCECCGEEETSRDQRTDNVRRLAVDHDHATGAIRGLLCKRCNVAIGYFESDGLYDKIVEYLA